MISLRQGRGGLLRHYFYGATPQLAVNAGDVFMAYVYLDPVNPPGEVMLQWNDGTWEHRAYWGANLIGFGVDGTNSRRYMGALPAAGQWVRLEVPASLVGLEGRSLNGMAFTLSGGRATWDHAGKRAAGAQGGLLVSHHVYFPFGEEIPPIGSEKMKFTGHQRDFANVSTVEDDLDYMHARYYNPLVGRFLSVDKVGGKPGRPQTWNRYAYVSGNPLKKVDPNGREEISFQITTVIKAGAVWAPALRVPPVSFFNGGTKTVQRFTMETDPSKSSRAVLPGQTRETGRTFRLDSNGNPVETGHASNKGIVAFGTRDASGNTVAVAQWSASNPLVNGAPPITYGFTITANHSVNSFSFSGDYGGYPSMSVTATNSAGQALSVYSFDENQSSVGAFSLLPGIGDQTVNVQCGFGAGGGCSTPSPK